MRGDPSPRLNSDTRQTLLVASGATGAYRRILHWLYLLILLLLSIPFSQAAEIQLNLTQETTGDLARVQVRNDSPEEVAILRVSLELNGLVYSSDFPTPVNLDPKQSLNLSFNLLAPTVTGSYSQRVTVFYLNEDRQFTLSGVAYVHYGDPSLLETKTVLLNATIRHEGILEIVGADANEWQITLPKELTILDDAYDGARRRVSLRATHKGFTTNYPIFAIRSLVRQDRHYAAILSAALRVENYPASFRGRMSNNTLLFLLIASGTLFYIIYAWQPVPENYWQTAFGKYAARLFWLSTGYLLLKNADVVLDHFSKWAQAAPYLTWPVPSFISSSIQSVNPVANLFVGFRDHLRGDNYSYFFLWFIDAYFAFCVVLSVFYSRYFDSEKPLRCDKYSASLARLLQITRKTPSHAPQSPNVDIVFLDPAKLGFLAICVKLFFLPYLTSWFINNLIHQWNLTGSLALTFASINAYLLALFLFIDSAIFAFGYAFESRQLKSGLRSVEPTFLGWLVCLWCYPPFNTFSFRIFDHPILNIHIGVPTWAEPVALAAITLSWGIFAWASLALGFKASNLTNRGIVSSGPYRWCRHPAYATKMIAWTIEAVCFGRYFLGLLFGFYLIYILRAWTEERHLLRDPEYQAYRNRVRYWFIPGVI